MKKKLILKYRIEEPEDFYHRIVKKNLQEFYADDMDIRKAINTCITMYHTIDWYCKDDKEAKKKILLEIPYLNALESISNGTNVIKKNEEILELRHVLEEIEKFWDAKLGKKYRLENLFDHS